MTYRKREINARNILMTYREYKQTLGLPFIYNDASIKRICFELMRLNIVYQESGNKLANLRFGLRIPHEHIMQLISRDEIEISTQLAKWVLNN